MLPELLKNRLSLPAIAAPMFLASNPALVGACCKAGIVGTFPALNQRSSEGFDAWLYEIKADLTTHGAETGEQAAPFGVNLIVHPSNPRLKDDLALCVKHEVPLVITSLGAAAEVVEAVHSYGGIVFHDVVNARHARKAASAGVDGLIAVSAGAGGHAGSLHPFALINEIRQFFDKTVILSGAISTGADVAAAEMLGADLAYIGTRFLATRECGVEDGYKQMLLESTAADIVYTPVISGVPASFLKASLIDAGIDPETAATPKIDLGLELKHAHDGDGAKPWRDVWSAGHGVGSINDLPSTAALIARLKTEYLAANRAQFERFQTTWSN